MKTTAEKAACTGCGACCCACKNGAVRMTPDAEGFLFPQIRQELCSGCGACAAVCPVMNGGKRPECSCKDAYACVNNDSEVLKKCSSGGAFPCAAEAVLRKGGLVCGAAFSGDFKSVTHRLASTPEEAEPMYGSKYLQSETANVFPKIKAALDAGRRVLFSGTPCQVSGLYAFLGSDREGLVTQDVICHGVASPLAWKAYADEMEKKYGGKISAVSFRDKTDGWKDFSVSMRFDGKRQAGYRRRHDADYFMKAYLCNLFLRSCCYECRFKTGAPVSDYTAADFWGVEKLLDYDFGTSGVSLVSIHTEKGRRFFDEIRGGMTVVPVDAENALSLNRAAFQSAGRPEGREKFFALLYKKGFIGAVRRALGLNLRYRIAERVRRSDIYGYFKRL